MNQKFPKLSESHDFYQRIFKEFSLYEYTCTNFANFVERAAKIYSFYAEDFGNEVKIMAPFANS